MGDSRLVQLSRDVAASQAGSIDARGGTAHQGNVSEAARRGHPAGHEKEEGMTSTESPTVPEGGAPGGEGHPVGLAAAVGELARSPLYWLLVALPLAAALDLQRPGGLWAFLASAVAIIPLAGLMGR